MSTFGSLYRVTTFGESHCKAVGVIIDGCPPGLPLTEADVQPQLSRRRPGQSDLTTPRDEKDRVTILSGTEQGFTLGTPIALTKYGIKAGSGGGRSSARETIGRVAASAVAEKYLKLVHGIEIVAFVCSVGSVSVMPFGDPSGAFPTDPAQEKAWRESWEGWWKLLNTVTRADVDSNEVRCPDAKKAQEMRERIVQAKEANDSIGGTVVCVIRNLPTGLAKLAHAMLSIPATKSFEIGSGLAGTTIPGHIHNDLFVSGENGKLRTATNFSGGIQGGISNGEDVYFKVGFKSVATISQAQPTAQYDGTSGVLAAKGRHDPCVLPRAAPIVESMATLTIMDALLQQNSRKATASALAATGIQLPPALAGKKRVD
ncbi:chorismate synthase [Obelidium mucronatum]|nr:chorismate synthase [Obelidium mucronatum]